MAGPQCHVQPYGITSVEFQDSSTVGIPVLSVAVPTRKSIYRQSGAVYDHFNVELGGCAVQQAVRNEIVAIRRGLELVVR